MAGVAYHYFVLKPCNMSIYPSITKLNQRTLGMFKTNPPEQYKPLKRIYF